jgi:hypothetical protein
LRANNLTKIKIFSITTIKNNLNNLSEAEFNFIEKQDFSEAEFNFMEKQDFSKAEFHFMEKQDFNESVLNEFSFEVLKKEFFKRTHIQISVYHHQLFNWHVPLNLWSCINQN